MQITRRDLARIGSKLISGHYIQDDGEFGYRLIGEMNDFVKEGLEEDARLLRAVNDGDLVVFHGLHSPLSVERWSFHQDKAIFYLHQ